MDGGAASTGVEGMVAWDEVCCVGWSDLVSVKMNGLTKPTSLPTLARSGKNLTLISFIDSFISFTSLAKANYNSVRFEKA
jgi:hypothetical protein